MSSTMGEDSMIVLRPHYARFGHECGLQVQIVKRCEAGERNQNLVLFYLHFSVLNAVSFRHNVCSK